MSLSVAVAQVTMVEGRVKDPSLPSKKQPRVHFKIGRELNHRTGDLVTKDWRVDKRLDRYWEKVRDARGRFVRWVDQKLTRHRGHGSAGRSLKS